MTWLISFFGYSLARRRKVTTPHCGVTSICISYFNHYNQLNNTITGGHHYKLYKPFSHCRALRARTSFFSIRVINVWNDLPADVVDFRSRHYSEYSHLRKPLVLLTCPNTSVIHIRNLPSYLCLPIHVCCIRPIT